MARTIHLPATILNGAAASEALDMRPFKEMQIITPAAWTAAKLGFQVCDTPDGNYVPLVEDDGTTYVVIDTVTPSRAVPVPAQVVGSAFVMLWSTDGAGNDTAQGADRLFSVVLKS